MKDTVLVVGAGPTGLALAIHLALQDVPVRLIDAASGPATTSRALGLQSRGVEVLERVGALGDLPQRSKSLLTMSYNDGPRTVLRLQVGQAAAALPKPTLLISQAEIEAALRTRFAELGGTVQWSNRLVAAEQHGNRVRATIRTADDHDQEVATDWLIGCDGAHSAVRKIAGIPFPGRKLLERLLMIDVAADWPYDPNGSTTWMSTGRMLSITALPDGVWRIFVEATAELPDDLDRDKITELVLEEFSRQSGVDARTAGEVSWATQFAIHRRLADRYRQGRILVAGDAAHIQSPTGGQGQNTGLADAENLGWKLGLVATGRAGQDLLDSYQAERRPLAEKVIGATSTAVSIMLPDTAWKRLVRDWLVMPAFRLAPVQRALWRLASQLGISYRKGPLAERSSRWAWRPRPGDRVPDLDCLDATGAATSLHAGLGGRWAVVAADRGTAEAHRKVAAARLGDDQVTVLAPRRPITRDVMIIRPDGHVGWRGRPAPEKLAAWLDRILWPS